MTNHLTYKDHVTFNINLYAHDQECILSYIMMQFGIQSEKGWMQIKEKELMPSAYQIKALSKHELEVQWNQIWELTHCIIHHLKQSPIFYPGDEFTEDVYHDFYFDEATEVIAAYDDHHMIGMIEWNQEENELLLNHKSVNVGEIYVLPQYRKTGLSTSLLEYVNSRARQEGYQYLWLEHGTANPNARGFWNQYFDTYSYNLIRVIQNKGENNGN